MSRKTLRVFESFLVVEGSGEFPWDMLRYDSAFPLTEIDSYRMRDTDDALRRIVLRRRSVNESGGTADRWRSFGWRVVCDTIDQETATNAQRFPRSTP